MMFLLQLLELLSIGNNHVLVRGVHGNCHAPAPGIALHCRWATKCIAMKAVHKAVCCLLQDDWGRHFVIASLHAPTDWIKDGNEQEIITIYESWFADVTAMISDISAKRKDCALLVSIDANAELGRNEIDELIDDNASRKVCVHAKPHR